MEAIDVLNGLRREEKARGDTYVGRMCTDAADALERTMCELGREIDRANAVEKENERLRKAFVLACRVIEDSLDCPAADAGADWPECCGELDQCGDRDKWECWKKYFRERSENEQICRVCGCTQENACDGGCWWVEPDLCSRCAEAEAAMKEGAQRDG